MRTNGMLVNCSLSSLFQVSFSSSRLPLVFLNHLIVQEILKEKTEDKRCKRSNVARRCQWRREKHIWPLSVRKIFTLKRWRAFNSIGMLIVLCRSFDWAGSRRNEIDMIRNCVNPVEQSGRKENAEEERRTIRNNDHDHKSQKIINKPCGGRNAVNRSRCNNSNRFAKDNYEAYMDQWLN